MLEHFCECYSDLSGPILCPVLGSITPLFIPNSRIRSIRLIGLCASLITFLYSPVLRIQFDPSTAKSQFVESLRWLPYENINFYLGIDGISLFFVILTTFLIPICISVGWSGMRSYGKEYITASLIREFLMIAVFRMLDLLLFYVLPESVPIPMLCGAEHLLFAGIKLFLCRGLEGALLGVCRGCVCSREWILRQVSFGGVDTLARIRVTATREKSKGNCTRPGMDNSEEWQQVETFILPPSKGNVGRAADDSRIGRIGKDQTYFNRSHHSSSSSVKAAALYLSYQRAHFSFYLEDGRCKRAGLYGRASPATKAALFATTREAKDSRVQAENTCIDSGLMTRADDGSSGRSRMMRKSHVRFPEKGVATYWSFDQPPPVSQFRFGATPYSTIIIGEPPIYKYH
ncbi:hypothetical protein ACFE04_019780 [Oxalis oulophora]